MISKWPIEAIPDEDNLFMRVHKNFVHKGNLKPKVFQERGDGDEKSMSTNWEKYSTAQETRDSSNVPADNGVIIFMVDNLRKNNLTVTHAPLDDNQAHTDVNGLPDDLKDVEIRNKLLDNFDWLIEI